MLKLRVQENTYVWVKNIWKLGKVILEGTILLITITSIFIWFLL
ncbi:MAG: hypothetical protein PHE43_00725 [Candidatus Nanoarchaeia archaeon]|nr:hypothetical protein [Candidatus Nanoarchaeia archaeon]